MKKRVLSLALAAVLCAGMLVLPAGAYDMGKVGERSTIVSASNYVTAVIDADGALWMWGYNGSGQQGNGRVERGSAVATKVLDNVVAVSCGENHTAAIKTDGSLWMWGANFYGELGNGGDGNDKESFSGMAIQTVPVKVLDGVAAVSCGSSHTAAIKTDGTLWMWGRNRSGQLGNGGGGNSKDNKGDVIQTVPVKVLDGVAAVSCGSSHTAAIKTDGTLWMWGYGRTGELGNGSTANSAVPVKVLDNVAAVNCGGVHTAAVKTDGSLWMWGLSAGGKLGNGGDGNDKEGFSDMVIQTVPIKVLDNVAAVSCGGHHTAAIKADGSLWTWGDNGEGRLGYTDANKGDFQDVPRQVTGITAPKGVRIYLNGGVGGGTLWTNAAGTIQVPTNPTREGYTFGG